MKLYKRMVRPYCFEGAWQGMTSGKTALADWMDEDEKTEVLEEQMEKKCKELDPMSFLRWEEKYEYVFSYHQPFADEYPRVWIGEPSVIEREYEAHCEEVRQ